jgi:1,4-dihydroxy-2-naphthoate octaprenyltransferase
MAARPATLPASLVPVLVGSAAGVGADGLRVFPFVAALACAVLIQIGTNLANDVADFQRGADTSRRLGPLRVTQAGLLSHTAVTTGMLGCFGLAMLCGLYLVVVGGPPILAIGLLCIAAGYLYTGGPYPLGYNGLGDLACFICFGPIAVCGSAYLQSGEWTNRALIASVPTGLMVLAILVVNNVRDIDTDRAAGKRTLAVLIGRFATRVEFTLCLSGAIAAVVGMVTMGMAGPWALGSLASLPLVAWLLRTVWTARDGPRLNLALKRTGQLLLIVGLCLSISLLTSAR